MDQPVHDFLLELCTMMRRREELLEHSVNLSAAPEDRLFFEPEAHARAAAFLADSNARVECQRFVRTSVLQLVFNLLVLFDEGRELGPSRVRPRISLSFAGAPVDCPTHLHELLGAVMSEVGMDTDEWFGMYTG